MAIHVIRSGIPYDSNIFLLTGSRNVLIDTGTGIGHDSVVKQIDEILNGNDLNTIVLTHCHIDHSGGAGKLMDHYGCNCFAYEDDAIHLRDSDESILDHLFGLEFQPLEVNELFEGDVIDIGDHRLSVLWTPGHTDGSICLYDEVTRSLFSGDTIFEEGVGRTDFPGGSLSELRSSVERISSIDIIGLYPGHGDTRPHDGAYSVRMAMRIVGV